MDFITHQGTLIFSYVRNEKLNARPVSMDNLTVVMCEIRPILVKIRVSEYPVVVLDTVLTPITNSACQDAMQHAQHVPTAQKTHAKPVPMPMQRYPHLQDFVSENKGFMKTPAAIVQHHARLGSMEMMAL